MDLLQPKEVTDLSEVLTLAYRPRRHDDSFKCLYILKLVILSWPRLNQVTQDKVTAAARASTSHPSPAQIAVLLEALRKMDWPNVSLHTCCPSVL